MGSLRPGLAARFSRGRLAVSSALLWQSARRVSNFRANKIWYLIGVSCGIDPCENPPPIWTAPVHSGCISGWGQPRGRGEASAGVAGLTNRAWRQSRPYAPPNLDTPVHSLFVALSLYLCYPNGVIDLSIVQSSLLDPAQPTR